MKIFFCDVCNESIPVKQVQEGQVHTIKGKVICPKCLPTSERPLEGATLGPAPVVVTSRAGSGSGKAGLVLGALGCILGAASAAGLGVVSFLEQAANVSTAQPTRM